MHFKLRDPAKTEILGAAPEGARDPQAAARAVQEMFTSIAPRYDLLNHVLSFNVDRLWWRRAARSFAHILARPDAQVLDLCCGTGDMTFALRRQAADPAGILGADFSHAMLYDLLGRDIKTLINNEYLHPGSYEFPFDGTLLASGVYIYKIIAGDYITSKQMIILK